MARIRANNKNYSRENDYGNGLRKMESRLRVQQPECMVTWANREVIAAIYARAKKLSRETGVQMHVDHIVPLQNDEVCGLHCEHNLRIITELENKIKGNDFDPDNNIDIPFFGAKPAPEELIPGLEDRSSNPPWRV